MKKGERTFLGYPPERAKQFVLHQLTADTNEYIAFTAVNGSPTIGLVAFEGTGFNSTHTISMISSNALPDANLECSFDKETWTPWIEPVTLSSQYSTVYVRNSLSNGSFSNRTYVKAFTMSDGQVSASGNVMSLVDKTCSRLSVDEYEFCHMFRQCSSLVAAPDLPATSLKQSSYRSMFISCSSLLFGPSELPATTIEEDVYRYMFGHCYQLQIAPLICSNYAVSRSYYSMFNNCHSLSSIKFANNQIIASGLDQQFSYMFENCSSLVSIDGFDTIAKDPSYPNTNTKIAINGMFNNCYALKYALTGTTINADFNGCIGTFSNCYSLLSGPQFTSSEISMDLGRQTSYQNMFRSCYSLQTSPKILNLPFIRSYGCAYMFYGCSSLTAAPQIFTTSCDSYAFERMFSNCYSLQVGPSTLNLPVAKSNCCQSMFYGCSSLTAAPSISAVSADGQALYNMFYNCYSLQIAGKTIDVQYAGQQCFQGMFQNCSSLTSGPQTITTTSCANGAFRSMFDKCTSLVTGPSALNVKTLPQDAYRSMFYNCSSLTSAPYVHATTLSGNDCLKYMFFGCGKVNEISVDFEDWNGSKSSQWVEGVNANGTFYAPAALPQTFGINNIPSNWDVVVH